MGSILKILTGGASHVGNVELLTPEQKSALSQIVGPGGQLAEQRFQELLGPQSEEDMESIFQRSYVDPALKAFTEKFSPAIQQQFTDYGAAGASPALQQALAQSAGDISASLGSQYGQFRGQQNTKQLQALQLLMPAITGQVSSPIVQQQQGILGPVLGAAGSIGAGMMMSSKEVKENIRDYDLGLEALVDMEVKQYDYKRDKPNAKDRVGLIAEDMPRELTGKRGGVLHVDLYGVLGVVINAIKELNQKIENLEGV